MRTIKYILYLLLPICCIIIGCSKHVAINPKPNEQFYLAHNIWWYEDWFGKGSNIYSYGMDSKTKFHSIKSKKGKNIEIASINYKVGLMIPIGSKVDNVKIGSDEINFRLMEPDVTITFNVIKKFEPLLTGQELFNRLISTKTFDDLTNGTSERCKQAIKSGMVIKGMSKSEVLLAFGYPSSHQTPSLDSNSWVYWHQQLKRMIVEYDINGFVKKDVIP